MNDGYSTCVQCPAHEDGPAPEQPAGTGRSDLAPRSCTSPPQSPCKKKKSYYFSTLFYNCACTIQKERKKERTFILTINLDFFGPKWHSQACSHFIQGPKKSLFLGPPPLKWPLLWICPPQNHYLQHHINNMYGTLIVITAGTYFYIHG
jgi:hypothetical protein